MPALIPSLIGVLAFALPTTAPISKSSLDQAPRTYLVAFDEPALLEQNAGLLKAGVRAKAAQDALAKAGRAQESHLKAASIALKVSLEPDRRYFWTNNAVALELTPKAAANLRAQPGIANVEEEFTGTLQTDVGPAFVGAQALWGSSAAMPGSRGAGVVVGIIDSGINTSHSSFAARASDGYVHQNARGQRFGLCNGIASARCSDKLIGLYDFTTEGNADASDLDGHGTHVAAIAVGNPFTGQISAPTVNYPVPISGVAPRANLIAYKACVKSDTGRTSCPGAALLSAIEQAVIDRVQVINYSIGGIERDPFAALNSASDIRAMFNARAAGVVVVVAAGNDGPAAGSVSSPANAPWVLGIGNISHDRSLQASLTSLSGSTSPPQLSFDGVAITSGLPDRAIVLGERFGNRLCGTGDDVSIPPTGQSNPFAPGTFNGEIVLCERGQQARIAKGFNVRAAGAGGMILINTSLEGESVVADSHYLPTVHLGQADGEKLRTWLRATSNARGRITATSTVRATQLGDVLVNSSGRGPVSAGVLKPDLAAPGANVLAADLGTGIVALTGTSMAAPHVAGAAALLRGLHPTWSVEEIESAIRTTARAGVVREGTGARPVDAFQTGAGRLQVDQADRAVLYFPLSNNDLRQGSANPAALNLPSLVNENCRARCSLTRTVKASSEMSGRATFSAQLLLPSSGLVVAMRPAEFNIGAGETQTITFDIDVSNPLIAGQVLSNTIELSAPGLTGVRLPLLVIASAGNVPEELSFNANAERGQLSSALNGLIALPRPSAQLSAFVKVTSDSASVASDTTLLDPFDGIGTVYRSINIATTGGHFWARVESNGGRNVNLYLGRDADGDGKASSAETLCRKTSASSVESCRLSVNVAGSYWLVVQNASGAPLADSLSLQYAAIPSLNVNPNVAVLPGSVAENTDVGFSFSYHLRGSAIGDRYVAVLALRADAAASAPMSSTLLRLTRTDGLEMPLTLIADREESMQLAVGQTLSKIGFSVPAGASQIALTGASSGAINAEIFRAPAGEANLTSAPNGVTAVASGQFFGGTANITLAGSNLTAGRYYLKLTNAGTGAASASLRLRIDSTSAAPDLAPELYYNPARSGHGLILTRARDDAQLIWYTYDQQGNPAWYWFFADGYFANNPKVVSGPLLRYTWDGSKVSAGQAVGTASVTRTGVNQFVWDFSLLGLSGSEPMVLLGKSNCSSSAAINASDYTGAWYQPARSGWGASVHSSANIEFTNFFVFDALGQPRWALGTVDEPRAIAVDPAPVPVYQHLGFCPTCAFVANTRRQIGSYRFKLDASPRLAAELTGTLALTLNFLAPLAGNFDQSGDFALLTGKKACVP